LLGLLLSACATSPYGDFTTGLKFPGSNQEKASTAPKGTAVAASAPAASVPATSVPPQPVPPAQRESSASEKKLEAALGSYERGEYALAIRLLTPLTTDSTLDLANQLMALKTLAFSQCLSRALPVCRQTFERAFRLDEKFDLAPAEQGHPVWGPQFERARSAVAATKGK
jgi:hypothetical protein